MSKHSNISIFVPHVGCPHKCSFCNQNSITGQTDIPRAEDVRAACEKALSSGIDKKNTEIAFFGGSFTAVPRSYMLELLNAAKPYVDMGFKGIRLSTRPDAITAEILDLLKEFGVTSIELGAQSMCEEVLIKNERGHTSQDVVNASTLIRSYGFTLGLQMMVGLYASTPELDVQTARRLISLCPDEVRIYPTVVLKGTRLGELYLSGEYKTYPIETAVELCSELLDMFENKGIRVIKLGLHSSCDVEKDLLGGIYHPAFRELCESFRFRKDMERLVGSSESCVISVKPKDMSKALGQHRQNIGFFKNKGITVKIVADGTQTVRIKLADKD